MVISPRLMRMAVEARKLEAITQLRRVWTARMSRLLFHDGLHPVPPQVVGDAHGGGQRSAADLVDQMEMIDD